RQPYVGGVFADERTSDTIEIRVRRRLPSVQMAGDLVAVARAIAQKPGAFGIARDGVRRHPGHRRVLLTEEVAERAEAARVREGERRKRAVRQRRRPLIVRLRVDGEDDTRRHKTARISAATRSISASLRSW